MVAALLFLSINLEAYGNFKFARNTEAMMEEQGSDRDD